MWWATPSGEWRHWQWQCALCWSSCPPVGSETIACISWLTSIVRTALLWGSKIVADMLALLLQPPPLQW